MKLLPLLLNTAAILSLTGSGLCQNPQARDQAQREAHLKDPLAGSDEIGALSDRMSKSGLGGPSSADILKSNAAKAAAQAAAEKAYLQEKAQREALAMRSQYLPIPKIELRETTFDSAIEYLRRKAKEAAGGAVAPNLVLAMPEEVARSKSVTVSLHNIPFYEALRYICELGNAEYAVEPYANVITEAGKPAAPDKSGASALSQPQLARVILPKLDIQQATLEAALGQIQHEILKTEANFNVVLGPVNTTETVTLHVENMPASSALHYIGLLSGAKMIVEPRAVVVADETLPAYDASMFAQVQPALSHVVLPKVDFQEATLTQALNALKQMAQKSSPPVQNVNFVFGNNIPADGAHPITLQLTSIPFYDALRYTNYLAGTRFTADHYAMTVSAYEKPAETKVDAVEQ